MANFSALPTTAAIAPQHERDGNEDQAVEQSSEQLRPQARLMHRRCDRFDPATQALSPRSDFPALAACVSSSAL